MERKRVAHGDKRGSQPGVEKDLLTGVILAIAIPMLAFLLARALDLQGWGQGVEKAKSTNEPLPMSIDHARDVLIEIGRLYQGNYSAVFLPRLERAASSDDDATRRDGKKTEFARADKIFSECQALLKRLKEELARPGSELAPLAGDIQRWDQELTNAFARHDNLNPIPASYRPKS